MKWTTERPTEPGFYWWKNDSEFGKKPRVLMVDKRHYGLEGLVVKWPGSDQDDYLDYNYSPSPGEMWAGPIALPNE